MATWKEELCDQLSEELEDVETYARLSRMAEADGKHNVSHFLSVIAHEEMTHAEYIKSALEDMGLYSDEKSREMTVKWERAKSSLYK